MFQWRVTKYDPQYRNEAGVYTRDEWIMVQQIGESVGGSKLTLGDYLSVEDRYIQAALIFLRHAGVRTLKINHLQQGSHPPKPVMKNGLNIEMPLKEGQVLRGSEIEQVVRMMLREIVSCELSASGQFFVHVGWDYYMYIGCGNDLPEAKVEVEKLRLFVENCESPYYKGVNN